MRHLQSVFLSSALLLAPVSMTAAFAQSTVGSSAGTQAPPTAGAPARAGDTAGQAVAGAPSTAVVPPAKNGAASAGMVRSASPDSATAQLQNPTGAQPGTGSGMGKVSGTAAGN
jgi:hypothetical protein